MTKKIEAAVLELVRKHFNKEVALDLRFVQDLGADSIDGIELLIAAENHFGILLPESEAATLFTPRDAISLIASKL